MPIFQGSQSPASSELRLQSLEGGLSLKYDPTQLQDKQSPYMVNVTADDRGTLNKRNGQAYLYASSLGAGGINGAYDRSFMGFRVFAWGTNLYKQSGDSAPVSIMSGLANAKGSFFPFQSKLYYLNGTDFVAIDPSLTAAAIVPYVPTLFISTPPTGGGTLFEQFNLLGSGFKVNFSGDGTAKVFTLPLSGLDATAVTATVGAVPKTETTDFTVDRTAGTVTFTVAPPDGTNNVIITAYKTVAGNADRIKGCTHGTDFGGDNDTRGFLWGNTDFPNRVFRSGLLDLSYWPENEYADVGTSSEAVVMCAKQYDRLIYLKERSLYFTYYSSPAAAGLLPSFPWFTINSAIGCDMPGSVQIIDNNVVFGNSKLGLFIILSTEIKDERNVFPLSGNINGSLVRPGLLGLGESALQEASSVDSDGRYWLCAGNVAYVWDYRLSPYASTGNPVLDEERLSWFYHTSINAACWMQDSRELFYGDRDTGQWVKFVENFNDFGDPIDAVWRSKRFNFNLPDWLKTVTRLWVTAKAGGYFTMTVKFISENGETMSEESLNIGSFRWDTAAWDTWTWSVNEYPPPIRLRPKTKKIVYFQVEFSNSTVNEDLSLLSLIIEYLIVRKVK